MLYKELQIQDKSLGKQYIPTRFEIFKTSNFGKPSLIYKFTSEACFEHVLVYLLKSDYFSPHYQRTLLLYHPLFEHLFQILLWSKTVDFSKLKDPITNYSDQKWIATCKVQQFLIATLHYDLNIPTVIRLLERNYVW